MDAFKGRGNGIKGRKRVRVRGDAGKRGLRGVRE